MKEDSFLSNENDIESDEYTILLSERTEHKTNIENEIKYWKKMKYFLENRRDLIKNGTIITWQNDNVMCDTLTFWHSDPLK